MPAWVVTGSQWGDEGKGKVVDWLTAQADMVVRYQGGNNAGHTVRFGSHTHVLHLVPSGIFHPGVQAVLGNGVVINPAALLQEIDELRALGVKVDDNLSISHSAHLVMPYHKAFDHLREGLYGSGKIGTTGKGIGPAYEDKAARRGIRFSDLAPEQAKLHDQRLEQILEEKNLLLHSHYHSKDAAFSKEDILHEYQGYYQSLKPFLCDTSDLVNQALEDNKLVLFEGAQGTGLDVDHGTYPYVTSSSTIAGGACIGAGVGPTAIDQVLVITKAYTTRVGEGFFPTELSNEDPMGEYLQKTGHEFGSTTGRMRRCGWLDAVVVRQAIRANGAGGQALMKMDVLDFVDEIKVAVAYQDQAGNRYDRVSHSQAAQLQPIYETLPGWKQSIRGVTSVDDLPDNAKAYIARIEQLTQTPVWLISTGPAREETIVRGPLTQMKQSAA